MLSYDNTETIEIITLTIFIIIMVLIEYKWTCSSEVLLWFLVERTIVISKNEKEISEEFT